MERQITDHLVMVRPAAFGFNRETAATNTFQHKPVQDSDVIQKAQDEFDQLVAVLRREGVTITVWRDAPEPVKPDAVFPNNWISFHANGAIVTYPMYSPLRRLERQDAFLEGIGADYVVKQHIALESLEADELFLEGTGSLVLDRVNRIAYACMSPRTDVIALHRWCDRMEYTPFTFHAQYEGSAIYHTNVMMAIGEGIAVVGMDVVESEKREALHRWCDRMEYTPFTFHAQYDGSAIYHTNVMMAIGEGIAVVGLDVVESEKREAMHQSLVQGGREVVMLTPEQIGSFAGNMLALLNNRGEQLMVMSTTALNSLQTHQVRVIQQFARIVACDVSTIEAIGGGSVRCMLAENFLPLK